MTRLRARVRGVGHYLPERIVPNSAFEEWVDTSDAWIQSRSGIQQRHFAAEGETTSQMAAHAARKALALAGWDAKDLDAIVVATSTADLTFPSAATMVQAELGAGGFAFDIQAVCAGFVFALANANALVLSGQAKRVLVIGAETFSRLLDMTDRTTCVLFGDGAGALLLEADESGDGSTDDPGILATDLHSDGQFKDILYVDGGPSTQTTGYLRMQGKEVFRHAVEKLAATAHASLDKVGLTGADVDWIVPHQANLRIIKGTAQRMGVPMERVILTVQDHGNTSAASIPLALSVGVAEGKIKPGHLVVMEAIGGGLAWGSVLLRW